MRFTSLSLAALTVLAGSLTGASADKFPSITVKGNAFYNGTERFYIRGVDYQPGGSSKAADPLADADGCARDLEYFQDLGINAIRVYTVDNSADHKKCMTMLQDAGIYVILDVNTPKNSINRADPAPSYNAAYLQSVFATIDAFKDYPNLLGFFAANEVINSENTTTTAPYVKAVVRDMKTYIKAQASRFIPVGYSAADVAMNRWEQMQYFNCGDDDMARIDMFGMNDYSWCGDSSFTQSGWSANVKQYSSYSVPMFLSEFGCNLVTPRPFSEIKTLYSTQMSSVYSGGLVYEYSQEPSNYGLVEIDGDDITKLPDYANLKKAYAAATPPSGDGGALTSTKASTCPPKSDDWEVDPNSKVPAMPKGAEVYIKNGAGKPLGLSAPSTQWASDNSNNDQADVDDSASSSASHTHSDASIASATAPAASSTGQHKKATSGASSLSSPVAAIVIAALGAAFAL